MVFKSPVTPQDIARLKQLCEAQPLATAKAIAAQWGRNAVTTGQYIKRLRLGSPQGRMRERSICCEEPLATIFRKLDAQGKSIAQQARELGIAAQTMGTYRRGEQSPTLYLVKCLAQMAHLQLTIIEENK